MEYRPDPTRWGIIPIFVCQHINHLTCERPQYARATLGWTPAWFEFISTKIEEESSFWVGLINLFPVVFGPSVLVCLSCKNVVFTNSLVRLMYTALHFVLDNVLFINADNDEDQLSFAIYPEDLKNIKPDTWKSVAKYPEENLDNIT